MGMADDMRKITENMIASYDARVSSLDDLVTGTRHTVNKFASDRRKMAAEQTGNLKGFANGLNKNVGSMIRGFQKSHTEMSDEQAKRLAGFVGNLSKQVGSMVGGFAREHGKMSKDLKHNLARQVKGIETFIGKRLGEFHEQHSEMSDSLRKSLGAYVGGLVRDVRRVVGGYGSDMKKARQSWFDMSSALAKARKGGVMSRIHAGQRVTAVKEASTRQSKKGASRTTRKTNA